MQTANIQKEGEAEKMKGIPISGTIIDDEAELSEGQRDLNLLMQWEKAFRADARADNYALFRNHLRKLELPVKPRLLLEGTIRMMRAIWVFANMDHQPLGQFLKMQQYDPSKSPDAAYVQGFKH
jgi:hypothetical protein